MLKEFVMAVWVCTPAAHDAPEDVGPTCTVEALTTTDPTTPAARSALCQRLGEEALKRWGEDGTAAPVFGIPMGCAAFDYSDTQWKLPAPTK